jgi:chromosome segregation ATPase
MACSSNSSTTNQMSFGLEALFEERLEAFPAELTAITHTNSSECEAAIKSLIKERDDLHAKVKDQTNTINHLERRIYTKVAADADLPVDVVRRLNRLENENQQLRKLNTKLTDNLRASESENATLCDTIAENSQKMKGASKKTKNAKEVAIKGEEKAKDAVKNKQAHVASERKMKQERNEAKAALSHERKIAEDLRAELEVEKSSEPHLRDTEGSQSNHTTLIVPVSLRIRRADFQRTMTLLRQSQKYFLERAQDWYEIWTGKVKGEGQASEGKYEESDGDEFDDDYEDKLYGGMVEGGDMMTGAEHDGRRSMKGLKKICRNAEAHYNE